MTNKAIDLTKGAILPTLLQFAWPILVSNVFQQLYNTADIMIVGHYLGESSLAAVGAATAIFELIIGFAIGVSNGMGIVIARHYGAKDEDQLKKSVVAALVVALVLSSLMMLFGHLGLSYLLEFIGTPAGILDQSYSYIYLILMGTGITFAYNLGAGLLRSIGNSLVALYFLVFSACLNVVLDLYFITQLGLGVQSAGLATIISQGVSVGLCYWYIWKKVPLLIPEKRHLVGNKEIYKDLLSQGLSMGIMFSIVSIGTVILQTAINGFGVLIIGAQTTARRLLALSLMPMTSVSASMTTFVSQNLGAKQTGRIVRGLKTACLLTTTWSLMALVLLYAFGPVLVSLVSGSQESLLLSNASLYLRVVTLFYPVLGCLFIFRNALQGLGQKLTPLLSSLIELVGKVLCVLIIIPRMGYLGVILCEPIIWLPMTAQLFYSLRRQQIFRDMAEQRY